MNMVVAISTVLVIFGGIGLAMGLGWWKTSGGGGAPAVIRQGSYTGMYDPADIRGSSSFGTIETYFNIPATLIAEAFGIQASDPKVVTAKFVDTLYGEMQGLNGETIDIGTDAVKLFVARMTGLPYIEEEHTGLPESAIDVVLALGAGMTDEQRQSLLEKAGESRSIRFDEGQAATPAPSATGSVGTDPQAAGQAPAPGVSQATTQAATQASGQLSGQTAAQGTGQATGSATGFVFQGKTSFADVMARGISQAQIESVLGMPMGPKIQSVKDFCESKGLKYSAVRAGLSQLMGL
jgi:hypothetical protein